MESTRVVLNAALIEGFTVDFVHIIADQLFFHIHKTHAALPFPCLITKLFKKANVPLISRIDNEVPTLHK